MRLAFSANWNRLRFPVASNSLVLCQAVKVKTKVKTTGLSLGSKSLGMASLATLKKKHKVTIVGSGNWYVACAEA